MTPSSDPPQKDTKMIVISNMPPNIGIYQVDACFVS